MITASRESPDLPAGWAQATLGDIVDVVKQQVDPRDRPNEWYNYLSIENVESNTGNLVDFRPTRGNDIRSTKLAFTTKDVLYSKLRPYLNKVHIPFFDGISATDLVPLRSRDPVPREFIAYLLRRRQTVEYVSQRIRGIELPRVPLEVLLSMPILLPPLDEQKRIITKVGKLSQELKTARQTLEIIPNLIKQFRQSVCAAAFRGELTERQLCGESGTELVARSKHHESWFAAKSGRSNSGMLALSEDVDVPAGWARARLGKICLPVETTNPRTRPDETFQYIDIASIDNRRNLIAKPKRLLGRDAPSRARQRIKKGDTLFSTVRTYLRNIALVPDEYNGQVCSTGFCVIRPMPIINPEFVFYYVLTDEFISKVTPTQTGILYPATKDLVIFGQPIPIPPRREQDEIASRLRYFSTVADDVEEPSRVALTNVTVAEQSILARAFLGELVPQNPTDEPASALIEHIRKKGQESKEPKGR